MLTANLARSRTRDGNISPLLIDPDDQQYRETARELIQIFEDHLGEPKGGLEETIDQLTIADTDYKIVQGLAKLLHDESEFTTIAAADTRDPPTVIPNRRRIVSHRPAPDAWRGHTAVRSLQYRRRPNRHLP